MDKNTASPLVSIIIPVYNGSNYMREAIDSALAQTYENIEIIVVNDGSTDGGETERIALSYGDRIRYISKENGGVSSALNTGIANMRGEYFSWLSHDDRYTPRKVEAAMNAVTAAGGGIIALCEDTQIDKDSKSLGNVRSRNRFEVGRVVGWKDVLCELFAYGSFNGCSLLVPRSVFDRVGGFDESLRYCQDWLMWLKIFLSEESLVYIDERCVEGRVHGGQLTQTGRALFHSDSEYIGELLIPILIEKSCEGYNFLYMFAKNNARYDNRGVVRSCLKRGKAAGLMPLTKRISLRGVSLYGRLRPFIRKLYYFIFKGIKVK